MPPTARAAYPKAHGSSVEFEWPKRMLVDGSGKAAMSASAWGNAPGNQFIPDGQALKARLNLRGLILKRKARRQTMLTGFGQFAYSRIEFSRR